MQAVLLRVPGGPEALEVVEQPAPSPAAGQVVVRAEAIGLGRPDVMMRTGKYKWMPSLPGIIGNELAGVVVKTGNGVDGKWLGRHVLVSGRELPSRGGCYAQEVAVDAQALIELPDGIDAESAVTLPNYQLAWGLLHSATRGKLPATVYLNGAGGGVGSAVVQLCRQLGIAVVGGASSLEKRRAAKEWGASQVVNSSAEIQVVVKDVLEATLGQGVDLVLDHLCGPGFISHLEMLAPFGLLVSYNALKGPAQGDVFGTLRTLAPRAVGIAAFNMHAYNGPAMRLARRALMQTPLEWMSAGRLRPAIGATFPITEVQTAHALLDSGEFTGKIVLRAN